MLVTFLLGVLAMMAIQGLAVYVAARINGSDHAQALDRATLNKIILKEETLKQAQDKGEVKVTGDGAKLDEMLGYMDKFEFWFNIVTP